MKPEQAARLREPFPPERIGKLPKAGRQFDFVGHAWVTDRLLEVDPGWTYEVTSTYQRDKWTVMWINLSVAGVTRPGVGIAATSTEDCEKLLVSDALKNAAMRFGVALDLWATEEHAPTRGQPAAPRYLDNATAKQEVLDAVGGDKAAAAAAWGDRKHVTRDEMPFLIKSALEKQGQPFE